MQDYKDVCGNNKMVWFEIEYNNYEKAVQFLQWAKDIGCVWLNGREIVPKKGAGEYFHFSIHNDGKLAFVSMMPWSYVRDVPKHFFSEYIKGNITLVYVVVEHYLGGKTLPEIKGVYKDKKIAEEETSNYCHAFVEWKNLVRSQWERLPTNVYVVMEVLKFNVPNIVGVFEDEDYAIGVAKNCKYDSCVVKQTLC